MICVKTTIPQDYNPNEFYLWLEFIKYKYDSRLTGHLKGKDIKKPMTVNKPHLDKVLKAKQK